MAISKSFVGSNKGWSGSQLMVLEQVAKDKEALYMTGLMYIAQSAQHSWPLYKVSEAAPVALGTQLPVKCPSWSTSVSPTKLT